MNDPPFIAHTSIARHRTAKRRYELSRPLRLALEEGFIKKDSKVFDYGCGQGDDMRLLQSQKINCSGWDPAYKPDAAHAPADVVNLGYVINVIENTEERVEAIKRAWELTKKVLIVSARLTSEVPQKGHACFSDGYLTQSGTFQKFYDQQELRNWIDGTLSVSSIAAAPGIFYVFRDEDLKQEFAASRFRRKIPVPRQRYSDVLYEKNKELFEPLINFLTSRGRLPEDSELDTASSIRKEIGSLNRAFKIIAQVTGKEQWERIREERSQDLLIHIALSRFAGRPALSQLSEDLQLDVRAFFSTYKRACTLADELLFSAGKSEVIQSACRKSSVGKLTSEALYIHTSALGFLPSVLRIYEGCARNYIGTVEGANLIKLHSAKPQISYLYYPEFERDPHPALAASLIVKLNTFQIYYREYTESTNPPILHRKETFIASDHPLRPKFERLTKQEEKHNLYEKSELIGTRDGWQRVLDEYSICIQGHRLYIKSQKDE